MVMEYSAGFIVVFEEKFLLVKEKRTGIWGVPKGHLEENETALQAAHRELYEEVGLTVEQIKGFEETMNYFMGINGNHKTVTLFLGRTKTTKVTYVVDEIAEHKWCTLEEAMQILSYDNIKDVIQKAAAFLTQSS